jgi:hypothetical protein
MDEQAHDAAETLNNLFTGHKKTMCLHSPVDKDYG